MQLFGPFADLFVTNVLNGTVAAAGNEVDQGTVLRLSVVRCHRDGRPSSSPRGRSQPGSPRSSTPSALVLGPTGVALEPNGTLYVADTVHSRIAAVPFATFRFFPASAVASPSARAEASMGPLGLALAPNGDLITVNGNDGNAVEVYALRRRRSTRRTIDPLRLGG